MQILIAEDSTPIRISLAKLLKNWGHEVLQAADGEEAWQVLVDNPVSLIISDWMMPKLDGVELCKRVRETKHEKYLYFILLTARSETSDLVEGMAAGADDFISKPFSRSELQVRIRAAERILDLQDELAERNEKLTEAYERIQQDLRSAAVVQRELLPPHGAYLPGVRCEWLFLPSTFVAGDIFDYFVLGADHVGFYHLDVAGHGIPSALLSVSLSRVLRPDPRELSIGMTASGPVGPAELMAKLNNQFQSRGDTVMYFTMVYGVLNVNNGHLRLCQAGHPPPLLVPRVGDVRFLGDGGFPVAMLPEIGYEEIELQLNAGDRLVLYSDGISDCMDETGEQYGGERIAEVFNKQRCAKTGRVLEDLSVRLQQWNGSAEFDDDVSILTLEYSGLEAAADAIQ